MIASLLLGAAAVAGVPTFVGRDTSSPVIVSDNVPDTAGASILRPFVSFSIEFAFFPDFAGTVIQFDALNFALQQRHC